MAKLVLTSNIKNPDNLLTVKQAIYHKKVKNYHKMLIASVILNISLISYIILTTI